MSIKKYRVGRTQVMRPNRDFCSLAPYFVEMARMPENPDSGEADIMAEQVVVGTEKSVKEYIEYELSKEWQGLGWRWEGSGYVSTAKGGKIIYIGYERLHVYYGTREKSIDVLLLPLKKGRKQ